MNAIETRYIGPTNTRGARIIASDLDGNRATISYPYELSGEECHRKALEALLVKMGWSDGNPYRWAAGATRRGYAWVDVGGFLDLSAELTAKLNAVGLGGNGLPLAG